MMDLCAPALIYVAFSLTQIIIDTFKGLYNTALLKFIIMIIITILLNALCISGMGIVSWIIVFIPFIFMSVIVTILLYVFGLDPKTGKLNIKCSDCNPNPKTGNLIYSSSTIKTQTPTAKYVDVSYSENNSDSHIENAETIPTIPTNWSSDPQYS
jgi:hypothetical protein